MGQKGVTNVAGTARIGIPGSLGNGLPGQRGVHHMMLYDPGAKNAILNGTGSHLLQDEALDQNPLHSLLAISLT